MFERFLSTFTSLHREVERLYRELYNFKKNFIFDKDGNIRGMILPEEIPDPEHKLARIQPYGSLYPINYYYNSSRMDKESDYDGCTIPSMIERHDNNVTYVFFGISDSIKSLPEDKIYKYEWGRVFYFAKKSEMSLKEFYTYINKYNRHPDEGVEH